MSIAILPEPEIKTTKFPAANGQSNAGLRPDDILYEIVNGQRVEMPPMSILAVFVASHLQELLGPFVRERRLGRVVTEGLFIMDADKDVRRRPDVAFVSRETWPLERPLPPVGDWRIVPDVAVEVNSPNDLLEEVLGKILEYFHYGVKQVWMISPTHGLVYVYSSPADVRILTADQELADTVVSGFRLNLAELFREQAKI
jgi:Uma2 family endonuclease